MNSSQFGIDTCIGSDSTRLPEMNIFELMAMNWELACQPESNSISLRFELPDLACLCPGCLQLLHAYHMLSSQPQAGTHSFCVMSENTDSRFVDPINRPAWDTARQVRHRRRFFYACHFCSPHTASHLTAVASSHISTCFWRSGMAHFQQVLCMLAGCL